MGFFIDYYWTVVPQGSGRQGQASSYDLNNVVNHDYFVSQKAFFWDLNVWDDEAPNDDPHQPSETDLKTLHTLMRAYYDLSKGEIMITVGGVSTKCMCHRLVPHLDYYCDFVFSLTFIFTHITHLNQFTPWKFKVS